MLFEMFMIVLMYTIGFVAVICERRSKQVAE